MVVLVGPNSGKSVPPVWNDNICGAPPAPGSLLRMNLTSEITIIKFSEWQDFETLSQNVFIIDIDE